MVQSQYQLSWNAYKPSICNGFLSLQQNGEFVDMTLAADGHFVKVHQMVIALSSSYLKDLISSASCQNPVVFLNNVSYNTLCLLLQYMYTGEVLVPAESLSSFMETAKSLHIKGLENVTSEESKAAMSSVETESPAARGNKRNTLSAVDIGGTLKFSGGGNKIYLRNERGNITDASMSITDVSQLSKPEPNDTLMDDSNAQDYDDDWMGNDDDDLQASTSKNDTGLQNKSEFAAKPATSAAPNFQFTVSIRGSLQVILNRYLYNLHSVKRLSGVRRWRCVDYRNNRCQAFVVTKGNIVLNRANPHTHPFHDRKILQKIEQKAVYSSLEDVEGYKEKEKELAAKESGDESDQ